MSMKRKPDFSGWATKFGIKCTDGRTILKGAFDDDEGRKVPIVWQHIHDDPDMVLGHAILYNRKEGVWTEGYFNNGPKAQSVKEALRNEDIEGLSIYANGLKHVNGREVAHGSIKELSVVLAGANMGATIQNVMLAHGDGMPYELEDEAIIYNDDAPLYHSEDGEPKKRAKKPEEDEEEEEEAAEAEEEEAEESSEAKEDEEEDEEVADVKKRNQQLQHADEGEEEASGSGKTVKEIFDSMTPEQKNVCYFLIAQAQEGSGDDDDDDTAEHSAIDDDEEDDEMRSNPFDRNKSQAPAVTLSHDDMKKIIERGVKLGSMRDAWEEALETNEVLAHAVYNDDGTEQTYGIANIDYLFPDYYELNDKPDFIRRDNDWVNVILNGVKKTPRGRMRTTHANITMDEARAKGYMKGNRKEEEVFNLLRRSVDPQTVYKKQKFDRDDIIDIDDFDVIAWTKAEMREMLNEEIALAILLGDGRSSLDPDKIFETHIKPIVSDDDLYNVKVTVTAGLTDGDTAKNAIRSIIKARKYYKGSGNLVLFTSEDWLSEWLLLEDQFGHELYKDEGELAKKMRVQRVVTVPQLEGFQVDNQAVMGIIVDLKDYATGTPRRGQIEFFDDFDIDFNQYKYLIETRLSGMLAKPFSAMTVKIATAQKGAPHYDEATPVGSENPKALGWYEREGSVFRRSMDSAVQGATSTSAGKTYYIRSTAVQAATSSDSAVDASEST